MVRYSCLPDELMNSRQGETVIIIGDGPSTGDFDLTDPFFTDHATFGCNRLGEVFKPTYYCLTSRETFFRYNHLVPDESVFLCPKWMTRHPLFCRHPLSKRWIKVRQHIHDCIGPPTMGRLYHGGKTGPWMLHVAYQFGFARFFLLGMDGYTKDGPKHFYETETSPGFENREDLAGEHLRLFVEGLQKEGKFVFNLSQRSVYSSVPKCLLVQAKVEADCPWSPP